MHLYMASAANAEDCRIRLSSEADFLHLHAIAASLNAVFRRFLGTCNQAATVAAEASSHMQAQL